MTIIPAIDIIDGKCVRLTQGDFAKQQTYYDDPVDAAKQFEDAGLHRLHLVDLDGARTGAVKNLASLQRIVAATKLQVDFGGGIKDEEQLKQVFDAGACMATIGSLAAKQPLLLKAWIDSYGADNFFIGADVANRNIKISGWLEDGGIDILSFLQGMIDIGARHFFCTDIEKDGALQGTAVELYKEIITKFPGIQLTASGGVSSMEDVHALKNIGCHGVIIGKAIYEGKIEMGEWVERESANGNRQSGCQL